MGRDYRHFTTQEIAQVQLFAKDASVSKRVMRERLGCAKETLERLLDEEEIEWQEYERPNKRTLSKDELAAFRKMASDPRVSTADAAKALGVSKATVTRLQRDNGIKWTPKTFQNDPVREPTMPVRRPPPRAHPNERPWAAFQIKPPTNPLPRKTPNIPVPEVWMREETRMGMDGWAYECPEHDLTGWKPGDHDTAMELIFRDLALQAYRKTGAASRGAAMESA